MIKDIKYQGYSGVPSDYESLDGDLAGSYNLVPEDGSMHPVFPPTLKFTLNSGEKVMWIHEMTGHTHYILLYTSTSGSTTTQSLKWICEDNADGVGESQWTRHTITDSTITGTPSIGSIGNTLIVNDDNGIRYFLWRTKTLQYVPLGHKPPMLDITFGLHSDFTVWPKTKNTGYAPDDYKGHDINLGRINDTPLFPKLGSYSGYQESAWVKPRVVYATETRDGTGGLADRYCDFADYNYTYSVEGKDDLSGSNNDMATVRNKFTTGVLAAINKFVNDLGTNENKFVMPFFVRYAYRLYDGSHIMHSYPVLMIPNSRGPVFVIDGASGLLLADYNDNEIGVRMRGRAYGFLSTLVHSIASVPEGLADWKDIITSVDICVSAPIYTYDQAGSVFGWTNMEGTKDKTIVGNLSERETIAKEEWKEYYSVSKVTKRVGENVSSPSWGGKLSFFDEFKTLATNSFHNIYGYQYNYGDYFMPYYYNNTMYGQYPYYIATVPQRTIGEIQSTLTGATSFYCIKRIMFDELPTSQDLPVVEQEVKLEKGVLGGLLGRKPIDDDYHTHDKLKASIIYNYNGRINYANAERTPHLPLSPSVQFAQASTIPNNPTDTVTVKLKDEKREIVIQSDSGKIGTFPFWIYYPDTNATEAYFSITSGGTTTKYRVKLTPHDFLNGAYWLGNIYNSDPDYSVVSTIPTTSIEGINDTNKIYTSNVNNPFYIPATGINTVGTGDIIGIRAAVKALSQGQFGQFPLYAFTTEGVWALEPSSTGAFIARQPVTRDVIIQDSNGNYNADSITQLDDAVLFATDRGIMLLSGSTCQCITDAINSEYPFAFSDLFTTTAAMTQWNTFLTNNGYSTSGLTQVPFSTFLAGCRMIYDYVHQRIVMFNTSLDYAYLYSLKDHKWGMMTTNIDYGINSYPEALAVTDVNPTTGESNVVNLSIDKTFEVVDNVNVPITSKCILVTRPLKLDQPDALKTIDTIIQRGKFDFLKSGRTPKPIRTILYGSRDLYNWFMISSSTDHQLRGFSGTPYKYFRIVLLCDLLPDESINGATIQYKPRYLNRPR